MPLGTPAPDDRDFMREAYAQARTSYEEGGVPVGAVMVEHGEIIGRGYNRRVQGREPRLPRRDRLHEERGPAPRLLRRHHVPPR